MLGLDFLDIDWRGLVLPFAYLSLLSGALMTFSTVYRKRKAAETASLAPWFPPHLQRNIYLSLMHLEPDSLKSEKQVKVPDSVLRAALLRRAVEDIGRIVQIRQSKQVCQQLLQRGSVGDDLWVRHQRAEKEMEEELRDVVTEANALCPNITSGPGAQAIPWGQVIFQTANEIAANVVLRQTLTEVQKQTDAERQWWEKRKDRIREGFMKELENEAGAAEGSKRMLSTPAKLTPSTSNGASTKGSSSNDGDAVLVEGGVGVPQISSTPSGAVAGKKKKGRK